MTVIPNIPEAELPQTVEAVLPGLLKMFDGDKEALKKAIKDSLGPPWPQEYRNAETGKIYKPHHDQEAKFVYEDGPRHAIILGGEGSGKTTASVIKVLERCRRRMSGVVTAPNLPHLKRSTWPLLARWIPWEQVVPKHRDRGHFAWEPYAPFTIAFENGATLQIGGLDDPKRWRGPNISFAFLDEIAVKDKPDAIKVLDGRVRIPGPHGEPPQLFCATTPEMHWLHTFYGPLKCVCQNCGELVEIDIQMGAEEICPECGSSDLLPDDEMEQFKRNSLVVRLRTEENMENLADGYAAERRQSLTAAESRVFMDAMWEDVMSGQPFLPTMMWWDECRGEVSPLDRKTPIVIAIDGATGRESGDSDCFGILAVSRHPDPQRRHDSVAVRYVRTWQAKAGQMLDFRGTESNPGPERELLRLCGWRLDDDGVPRKVGGGYNVKCVVADPLDLHDMITRFERNRIVWMRRFGQMSERVQSDNDLLKMIQEKRVLHDGNDILRRHLKNADRKLDSQSKKLRIVKRLDAYKIDLAICLSMGSYECLRLML